ALIAFASAPLGRLPVTRYPACPSERPAAAACLRPAGLARRWRGGGWAPGGAGGRRQGCARGKGVCIFDTPPERVRCPWIVHGVTPSCTETPWLRLRGASEALGVTPTTRLK